MVVFDLPPDVRNPRLPIRNVGVALSFLTGDENGFFHRKTVFQWPPAAT